MKLCSEVQGVISQSVLPVKAGNCVWMMILGMESSSGVVSACWVSSVALAVTDRLRKNLRTLRQLMWRHKAFVGLKLFACYFHLLFPEICYELDGLKLDNCRSQHSKCNSNFKIQRNEFSNFENLILKIIECVLLKIPWWHGISKFQAWKKIWIVEKIGGM